MSTHTHTYIHTYIRTYVRTYVRIRNIRYALSFVFVIITAVSLHGATGSRSTNVVSDSNTMSHPYTVGYRTKFGSCTLNGVSVHRGDRKRFFRHSTPKNVPIPISVNFVTKIKTRTRIIGRRFQRTRTRIIVIQKTKTK